MTDTTKSTSTLRATKLIAGTKAKYPNGSQTLSFDSGDHTVDEIVGKLQTIVDLRAEAETARAASRAKVAAERLQLPALLVFMSAYVAFLKAAYGEAPDALAIFGLPTRKAPTPRTAKAKAAAVVKGEATRTARAASKDASGGVVDVVLTPVKAGAPQPVPPETPAATPVPAAPTATPATPPAKS